MRFFFSFHSTFSRLWYMTSLWNASRRAEDKSYNRLSVEAAEESV